MVLIVAQNQGDMKWQAVVGSQDVMRCRFRTKAAAQKWAATVAGVSR
jgi:hypothetical protein